MTTSQPWWLTDQYDSDEPIPHQMGTAGPRGIALVQAFEDGRTQPGWGLNPPKGSTEGFMPRYMKNEFSARRAVHAFKLRKQPFAFVMRSVPLVCIDIDGKNGGLDHAKRLGLLPPTLGETSKSGNGLHLFYSTAEAWDADLGFAVYDDHIGIEQGVDIRAVGCVFHYPSQRWNHRDIAPLPEFMAEMFRARKNRRVMQASSISKVLESNDDLEIMMMQTELESELAKPIPAGKRNNTLFAIGSQMKAAGVEAWDTKVSQRANDVGLDGDEIDKLIANIERYAPVQP